MLSVKEIVKELKVFERNKIPLEIKILGITVHSNVLGEKNCQNSVRASSSI